MDKKQIRICGQDGQLSTEKDEHSQFPYTAIFDSNNVGIFYGYGRTKREAIEDAKEEVKFLINITK